MADVFDIQYSPFDGKAFKPQERPIPQGNIFNPWGVARRAMINMLASGEDGDLTEDKKKELRELLKQ